MCLPLAMLSHLSIINVLLHHTKEQLCPPLSFLFLFFINVLVMSLTGAVTRVQTMTTKPSMITLSSFLMLCSALFSVYYPRLQGLKPNSRISPDLNSIQKVVKRKGKQKIKGTPRPQLFLSV